MEKLLVSACLLGVNCRYDGNNNLIKGLEELKARYNLIPVCPEILGGMAIPRKPVELKMGHVFNRDGQNFDREFLLGATESVKIARICGCHKALLQARSPSCGYGSIYDGTFTRTLVPGNGLAAALLEQAGLEIYSSDDIEKLLDLE